jgi:hypothetical protein
MTDLQIKFLPQVEIPASLQLRIDTLDHLSFAGEESNETKGITWDSGEWMGLGFIGKELVTQMSLPKREILVGAERIWVAGVSGMATHPGFQHKGYGSALLRASASFMHEEMKVPFGLLVCGYEIQRFYELSHWQLVASRLFFTQADQRRELPAKVMVLLLENQIWPPGEIDLCGLPW